MSAFCADKGFSTCRVDLRHELQYIKIRAVWINWILQSCVIPINQGWQISITDCSDNCDDDRLMLFRNDETQHDPQAIQPVKIAIYNPGLNAKVVWRLLCTNSGAVTLHDFCFASSDSFTDRKLLPSRSSFACLYRHYYSVTLVCVVPTPCMVAALESRPQGTETTKFMVTVHYCRRCF